MTTPADMPDVAAYTTISRTEHRRLQHTAAKRLEGIGRKVRLMDPDSLILLHQALDDFHDESRELRAEQEQA
ncbi:hypothetical protein [Gordonia sp. ABSL49_1]|uniref:hypothetical protein n=1 Tax=Gordonia sp. ABSL49_1 TaxID=2920941 RepID=UPI001F0EE83E|nr:hypothetical protein [Gordonia sp. ABSL49_1]MCH5641430.1 hypothetical protein [Gordonia sp. ABSL49_1]